MKITTNRKTFLIMAFLVILVLGSYLISNTPSSSNGISAEAGIIKPDGTIILFGENTPLSIYTVNDVSVGLDDIIFFRTWLSLTATGISGHCTGVRFNLWQTWQGAISTLQFGTEGVPAGNPPTKISEPWNDVDLPKDVAVTVPIKFRDILYTPYETTTDPLPYSMWDASYSWDGYTGCMVREMRFFFCREFESLADGTYTLGFITTVYEVRWRWSERGVTKTGSVTLSPNEISALFTISKTTAGLSASLDWQKWG